MKVYQVIPMRFIIMMGHFVLLVLILWNREDSVNACTRDSISAWDYAQVDDLNYSKDTELIIGLSIAIGLIVIEFIGFMTGITMFSPMQSLFSLIVHSSACITLTYFIMDVWDCTLFWWIFAICSVLPALAEVIIIVSTLTFKTRI